MAIGASQKSTASRDAHGSGGDRVDAVEGQRNCLADASGCRAPAVALGTDEQAQPESEQVERRDPTGDG